MPVVVALALTLLWFSLSLLPWVKVPTLLGWQATLVAGECGQWLVWFTVPLALLISRLLRARHPFLRLTFVAVTLCAIPGFVRPWWRARQLGAQLPGDLRRVFAAPDTPRTGEAMAHAQPVSVRTYPYAEYGATTLHADVYSTFRDKGRPLLLIAHAGGWDSGDRTQFVWTNRLLAESGMVVVAIDYRLAPANRWPAQRDDVARAVAWVREHAAEWGADPARIVLAGRSAGGQVALAAAYQRPDLQLRGVVSLYGPADLNFAWYETPEIDVLDSKLLMRQLLGGTPEAVPAAFADASPYLHAGTTAIPTLLIHGRIDTLVWYRQSERLAQRLQAAGATVYFLDLPWATHGFDINPYGPGGRLARTAIEVFVDSVAGPALVVEGRGVTRN